MANRHPGELPELTLLKALIERDVDGLTARVLGTVSADGRAFPVHEIALGTDDPTAPCVLYVGGVHGVERIGSQVVLAFLGHLIERLSWDRGLRAELDRVRLVFVPLVNPAGMWRRSRCNAEGVDLMRNAPVIADGRVPWPAGGQRLSAHLPWYRGRAEDPMAAEARMLCDLVRSELSGRAFALSLDCHSGFGMRDRLWFPYAYSVRPFEEAGAVHALSRLFEAAYPNHVHYLFEPQSRQYTTHGDLWDYLYLGLRESTGGYLPLTLEMGSWVWVKKNPLQIRRLSGLFNPVRRHRLQRTLRRHLVMMEFLMRAAADYDRWYPRPEVAGELQRAAFDRWYRATCDA